MKIVPYIRNLLLVLFALWQINAQGQDGISNIKITGQEVVITIDRTAGEAMVDSIVKTFGTQLATIDSIWNQAGMRNWCTDQGWCVRTFSTQQLIFVKPMGGFSSKMNWSEMPTIVDDDWIGFPGDPHWQESKYGVNDFDKPVVKQLSNGLTQFTLPGHLNANRVYLSGSFNSWSTLAMPMTKTDNGWKKTVSLEAGKHLYKFIVDGEWMYDPNNNHHEPDGHGGKNSIYYENNHTFRLPDHTDARKVYVAGSFNGWDRKELRMEQTDNGWELPMYLREGTHTYKFVVDRRWIIDPDNPVKRNDGSGNFNSVLAIGDTFYFHLDNYENANEVFVTGDFNAWNERELSMTKTDSGWVMPYVMAPGNYEYKYIVDGRWIIDSSNPHTIGTGDYVNSILTVDPNYTFRLENHKTATQVLVSGNFNGWNESGYTLEKVDNGWEMDLYLTPGKYRYKFVVDGEWILDPDNELYEENEYGTGNSVIWVEPGTSGPE